MLPLKGSLLHCYRIDTVHGGKEVYQVFAQVQAMLVSIVPELAAYGYVISTSKRRVAGVILPDPVVFVRAFGMQVHQDAMAFMAHIER